MNMGGLIYYKQSIKLVKWICKDPTTTRRLSTSSNKSGRTEMIQMEYETRQINLEGPKYYKQSMYLIKWIWKDKYYKQSIKLVKWIWKDLHTKRRFSNSSNDLNLKRFQYYRVLNSWNESERTQLLQDGYQRKDSNTTCTVSHSSNEFGRTPLL